MLEEIAVTCPYCWSRIRVLVDTSAGDQDYIEDCERCCRPIEFRLRTDGEGRLRELEPIRSD